MLLEELTSGDKLGLGDKGLHMYQMLMQHVARDKSELIMARRKDAACSLGWILSVIPDATIQAYYLSATGGKALEKKVSSVILNVHQSTGNEKNDGEPRQNRRDQAILQQEN